jgi:hypothetical protein
MEVDVKNNAPGSLLSFGEHYYGTVTQLRILISFCLARGALSLLFSHVCWGHA